MEQQYYWITDPLEEYLPARLATNIDANNVTFEIFNSGGKLVRGTKSQIVGTIAPPGNVTLCTIHEDLVENDDISEASIMWCLKTRFFEDKIYSSIGSIIIALNPYKSIDSLYSQDVLQTYCESQFSNLLSLSPHIWRIAHGAYVQLCTRRSRQAIVISGESGAGKTETTKKCLQYLSAISLNATGAASTGPPIEDRVLGTNPLLESFGNAKTARNDNSSRFGKWLEIIFQFPPMTRAGHGAPASGVKLTGAVITQYLLEKSRVVFQSENERNYHVFYQICSHPRFELGHPSRFNYLSQSNCVSVDSINDSEEMSATLKAFENLQFPESDQQAIFDALKAVLFLGNIEIGVGTDGFNALIQSSCDEWVEGAANMLSLKSDRLRHCILNRSIVARGETMEIRLQPVEAVDARNALAKEIYGRLFSHIVYHCNSSLRPPTVTDGHISQISCGLLDIFGFELLQCNSFEQLCINFANEKLQQYFLQFVLKREQELYELEGITVPKVMPRDNEDVLQLIESKSTGLFARLDEEVKIPKGSDAGFLSKIEQDHNKKTAESRFFRDVKMTKTQFEIRHFAGVVRYESVGFVEKNKDKLHDTLETLLTESSNASFKSIMEKNSSRAGDVSKDTSASGKSKSDNSKTSTTLSNRFQLQLSQLVEVLNASDSHFVRCIKPNSRKVSNEIESSLVLRQLQYSGVLEAVQIRKNGYPIRRSLAEFRKCYWMLSGCSRNDLHAIHDDREKCVRIVEGLSSRNEVYRDILVGRTIVFFRSEVLQSLEQDRLAKGVRGVTFIQSKYRKMVAVRRVLELRRAREEIRALIAAGSTNNSTNTDVLTELKDRFKAFQSMKLVCIEMSTAAALIKRLEDVLECKNHVVRLLSPTSSEHYKDVSLEYQSIVACMTKVTDLGLQLESYGELEARKELLKERAEALFFLREAMDHFDDGHIKEGLSRIAELNTKYGMFCAEDEEYARAKLGQIQFESGILSAALLIIQDFQSAYRDKLVELEGSCSDIENETWKWLNSSLSSANSKLYNSLSSFESRPPVSPLGRHMNEVFQIMLRLREDWLSRDWTAVATNVNGMLVLCKDLTIPQSISMVLAGLNKGLGTALGVEVALLRDELDRNVVLPSISMATESGRIFEDSFTDKVNFERVDVEAIASAVAYVQDLEWTGVVIKELIKSVHLLWYARQAVIDERWRDGMKCSERTQTTIVRENNLTKFCTEFKAMGDSASSGSVLNGLVQVECMADSSLNISALRVDDTSLFVGAYNIEYQKIDAELKAINRLSLDNYLLVLCTICSEIGKVRRDSSGQNFRDVDLKSLVLALEESQKCIDLMARIKPDVLNSVELLIFVRSQVKSGNWAQLVNSLMESKSLFVDPEFDERVASESNPVQVFLKTIKEEIFWAFTYGRNRLALDHLVESLGVGCIGGNLDVLLLASCSVDQLQKAIDVCDECSPDDLAEMQEDVKELLDFAKAIVRLRQYFVGRESLAVCQSTCSEAMELLSQCTTTVPAAVKAELQLLQHHILLCRSKELLMEGLHLRPPVLYVLPKGSSPSQGRRNSFNGGDQTSQDNKSILDDENMQLNEDVLSTELLRSGLGLADQFFDALKPNGSRPPEFSLLVTVADNICKLREAVSDYNWELASRIIDEVRRYRWQEKLPIISEEIIGSEQAINAYLVITECTVALSSGYLTGPVGAFADPSSLVVQHIEKAISVCQRIGCRSGRAEALFKAVLAMYDLRKAQLSHDWGTIKMVLRTAEASNLGTGVTAICAAELQRAQIERDNYDAITSIKRSLVAEEIEAVDGIVDVATLTTEKLQASVSQANAIPASRRGDLTNAMAQLGETAIKFRRAASMQQAFTVETFIEALRQDLDMLSGTIDSFVAVLRKRDEQQLLAITPDRFMGSIQFLDSPRGGTGAGISESYEGVFNTLRREIVTIQHHFAALELENDIVRALQEDSMTSTMIGLSDWSKIRVDKLKKAIETKREYDAGMKPLPQSTHNLFRVAHLIMEMRAAIVANTYEALSPLIEEAVALFKVMPEFSRMEVQAVRHELENRWIISNMTDALKRGRLEGSPGNVKLAGVSYDHLETAIRDYAGMNPRTDEAKCLVFTAESILPVRRLLCEDPINWPAVKSSASERLAPAVASTLHESVLQELRFIQATADDFILCGMMEAALREGGPSGEPGFLRLDKVDVSGLAAACQAVIGTSVQTDRTQQLWTACRHIKNLREALLRSAQETDEVTSSEAHQTISAVLNQIMDERRNSANDQAWSLCREEVMLIRKNSYLHEIREGIVDSVRKASRIFENRSKMSVAQGGRRASAQSAVGEVAVSTEDLALVVRKANQFDFSSDLLYQYVNCAKTLISLRDTLIAEQWDRLNELVSSEKTLSVLGSIPISLQELSCIKQESHNYQVIDVIEKALQPRPKDEVDNEHLYLVRAIQTAETAVVTSVTARQLLECARNVLQLRVGLSMQDSKAVGAVLRWFKLYSHQCPAAVQQEFQRAYIMHQNDLLLTGLTEALSTGAALGTRGELDISSIDTSSLSALLEQAHSLKHQTAAVRELIEAAEVVFSLRCAMKKNDSAGVMAALEQLQARKAIPDIILEEIASARAEVENCTTISALYEGLSMFDDANPKSLELSLLGTQQLVLHQSQLAEQQQQQQQQNRPTSQRRRYSYENINASDIDPETINVAELDHALEVAKEHGVLTEQARRLFRTTQFIRSLRSAMKIGDWPRVQEIITESNFSRGVGEIYDHVAAREVQVIVSQLQMRKSVVDLSQALKVGWAHCSNGIVDVSSLNVKDLIAAVERAEKSMVELGHPPAPIPDSVSLVQFPNLAICIERDRERVQERNKYATLSLSMSASIGKRRPSLEQTTGSKSATQSQMELLLSSARVVVEVREHLARKELDKAGTIADEGIRSGILHSSVLSELKLYSIEINRALGMMKLCQALREGMAQGDLDTLEPLINEARKASMQLSNDLGLVRTLEKAQLVYKSFLACRKALVKLSNNYNAPDVQQTIENAVAINISGYLIQNARTRLGRLRDYEAAVEQLRRNGGGALVDEQALRTVVELGQTYGMKHHPWTHRSEICLKLSPVAMRTGLVAESVGRNKPVVASTETMRLKRAFLLQATSRQLYSLEQFPRLRTRDDFFFRVSSGGSRVYPTSTLLHTDEHITTSLTALCHPLAALSVWIFTNCVQGLERQLYSRPDVLLRNLIIACRNCAGMRDEVLLLVIKQLRNNPNPAGCARLWNMLIACLAHFPPSRGFENYLELYLLLEAEEGGSSALLNNGTNSSNSANTSSKPTAANASRKASAVLTTPLPQQSPYAPAARTCIRHLHESVFRFGYTSPIISKCDLSLKTMSNWLVYGTAIGEGDGVDGVPGQSGLVGAIALTGMLPFSPQLMRGTRSNWIERFNLFVGPSSGATGAGGAGGGGVAGGGGSGGGLDRSSIIIAGPSNGGVGGSAVDKEDGSKRSRMTSTIFVEVVSSFHGVTSVDRLDRELLQFVVFGRLPEHYRCKIGREYYSDTTCFTFASDLERSLSQDRRKWLRHTLAQQSVPAVIPAKASERKLVAAEFWETCLVRMSSEFEQTLSSREAGGKVIKKVNTVSKASFTTITWEVYRELVLTAMELFLESEHNRAEQLQHALLNSRLDLQSAAAAAAAMRESEKRGGGNMDGLQMFSMDDSGEIHAVIEDDSTDVVSEENFD